MIVMQEDSEAMPPTSNDAHANTTNIVPEQPPGSTPSTTTRRSGRQVCPMTCMTQSVALCKASLMAWEIFWIKMQQSNHQLRKNNSI